MVIVKLQGGIGNQLFQFAFGRALAEMRKDELYFDLSFINARISNVTIRPFKLGSLKNYRIADQYIMDSAEKLFAAGSGIFMSDDFPKEKIVRVAKNVDIEVLYLDGYFQNEFYFFNYKIQIKAEIRDLLRHYYLIARIPETKEISDDIKSVAVHIRRTDYLSPSALSVHGICNVDYYQRAIDLLIAKVNHPHFYLFSDDHLFADELFTLIEEKKNISSVMHNQRLEENDLIELALMSSCHNFIIANSSYSWWGSYLSEATDKIIVAPVNWYKAHAYKQQSDDIALASWIRI